MADVRIVLQGPPYSEPRYYGKLQWNEHNVYVRHVGGGKDSRHSDGAMFRATTGQGRAFEQRVPTSAVSREFLSFISLGPPLTEPPRLRGSVRDTDLVLRTTSAGSLPRIAVEIVANGQAPGVAAAWERHSGVSSVCTCIDKGLGQSLIVAVAGALTEPPSTSAA